MKRIIRLGIVLVAFAVGTVVRVAGFTDGNLVIFRMGGGGGGALTNAGTAIFLDEYTTNGALVGSLAMPTTYFGANSPLIANGTAFGNGLITRSGDGRFILVTGYGAQPGDFSTSLGTTFATVAPRVIALVGGNGNIDSTTTLTNNASGGSSGGETRGAVSVDGTNFWTGGDALSAGGIQYTTLGNADATNLVGFNTRQLEIYSNQLYLTGNNFGGIGATGTIAILTNAFGVTLPTATNSVGILAFAPDSTNVFSAEGFAFFKLNAGGSDPVDTLYLLDAGSLSSGASKFCLDAGNWVYKGSVLFPQSLVGLAANVQVSGGLTNVNIYVSGGGATLTGGDAVYKATDATGYDGTPTASSFLPFISGAVGKSFRGIAFAPVGGVGTLSGAGNISVGPVIGLFANGDTGCALSSSTSTQTYSIANLGTTGPISWQANCPSNWVTLSPSSGSLPSGGSATVSAFFNANVTSLPGSLDGVTNTTTITFTNTTSAIGTTTRAVRLIQRDQDITPSTDYTISGQPGGPFSPTNKNYTVFNGSTAITLGVSKSASWLNLSATSVSIGSCTSAVISVSVNTNNANLLTPGNYTDTITFSNATAGGVIDTRAVNLTVGGIFFCDDFSTFIQNTAVEGQQGWVASTANPSLQVTNNAVYDPAATTGIDEPYKNIPLTSNNVPFVYAAMVMTVTSAPPLSTASPSRGPIFWTGQNGSGFARDWISARDTGTGTFVFCIRKNAAGNAYVFGTTPLTYGTTYRVIMQTDPGTDLFMALYVDPSGAPVNTNAAYLVAKNLGAIDPNVGSFSLQSQFGVAATPSPGYAVYKLCVTTNATDAYNDVQSFGPVLDPFTVWQNQYFGGTNGNALAGADPDGDGMINTNEYLAGFDPTNNAAYVHVTSVVRSSTTNIVVTYLGANGNSTTTPAISSRTNVLEFTTGKPDGSYSNNFVSIGAGGTNVLSGGTGLGTVTSFVDTNGATGATKYYRVRVLVP